MKWPGFLFWILVFFGFSSNARIVERVVAVVYDLPILDSDLTQFARNLKQDGLIDEALVMLHDPKLIAKDRNEQVSYLIDEKILDFEVTKRNLEVTFERVEQEIRNITDKRGITRAQLKSALAQKGVGFAEYQDFIKKSLQRQSLIEREVSSKIKVSDEDIAAFFLAKKGSGRTQVYEYSLAHILFLTKDGGESEAKERAQEALNQIRGGTQFEKVAETKSEDPNFSQGGFLGNFKSGEMLAELEGAVSSVKEGGVSGIVKTRMGFHLIKVLKKVLISDPELDRRREEIRSHLFSEAFRRQFRNWLDQRREDAFIKVN